MTERSPSFELRAALGAAAIVAIMAGGDARVADANSRQMWGWKQELSADHVELEAGHQTLQAAHDGLSDDHETLGEEHLDLLAGQEQLSDEVQAVGEAVEGASGGWDRKIPDVDERFVVLADFDFDAVLDRETGLVWQRAPGGTARSWDRGGSEFGGARFICVGLRIGERFGWRLPTVHELITLMKRPEADPALPTGHPFILAAPSGHYWTSTTVADDTTRAYRVRLGDGGINLPPKGDAGLSWCVRGRQVGGDVY